MNNIKLLKAQAKLALTQIDKKIAEPIKKYINVLETAQQSVLINGTIVCPNGCHDADKCWSCCHKLQIHSIVD